MGFVESARKIPRCPHGTIFVRKFLLCQLPPTNRLLLRFVVATRLLRRCFLRRLFRIDRGQSGLLQIRI